MWPAQYITEALISGSSMTSVKGCPGCCGAAAGGRMVDSSTHGMGGTRLWVQWPSETSAEEALNPDTGRSTLWVWLGLSGWAENPGRRVPASQVSVRKGPSFWVGHVWALGRTTVLSQQGSIAQWCHV